MFEAQDWKKALEEMGATVEQSQMQNELKMMATWADGIDRHDIVMNFGLSPEEDEVTYLYGFRESTMEGGPTYFNARSFKDLEIVAQEQLNWLASLIGEPTDESNQQEENDRYADSYKDTM